MNWKEQIVIEPIKDNTGDLFIVNCARVSHANWRDSFDGDKDQQLLNFLARSEPPHKAPFSHPAHTFMMPKGPSNVRHALSEMMAAEPYMAAGIIVRGDNFSMSVLAMVQVIRQMEYEIPWSFKDSLNLFLNHNYKGATEAFKLQKLSSNGIIKLEEVTVDDPWLQNITFRCTAPIWLTRQLGKHQVGLRWSEVSRRYRSHEPELFNQETRVKAENVKQGSGEVMESKPTIVVGGHMHHSIYHVTECLTSWYKKCIKEGLAPETVRGFLPQNMLTTWIWSGSRAAFEHLIYLRDEAHAQVECQYFAQQLKELM